ncbi:MAG TPA: hypothetical protein VLM89_00515 [Phycisphaerae bacterium]|nr:hypothetical protein [Phycisphaerae bacterium]
MRRPRSCKAILTLTLTAAMTGPMVQLGCVEKLSKNFNPCGTILNCDPAEYDLMIYDYPDWRLDPTCTIPGQCGGVFPFNTTGSGTTPTTTTTTTTTGTTTGGLFGFF